jgi:hypothetical protein
MASARLRLQSLSKNANPTDRQFLFGGPQSPYDLQAVVQREGLIWGDDSDVLDKRLRDDLSIERIRMVRR